jgi:hypothetical protein
LFNPKPDFTEHRGSRHEEFVQWLFAAERNPVDPAAQIGHGNKIVRPCIVDLRQDDKAFNFADA